MEAVIKLSVIIPVYNGEETLALALDAICKQSGWQLNQDYEVLVIDDGSIDRSCEIASKYPVTLIRLLENRGRIIARETGARKAQSDLLLFIDTRVIAAPDLLQRYDDNKVKYPIAICGDLGEESKPNMTGVDKLFLALRGKYYRPGYPQTQPIIEITPSNFSRTPKGTGCLFIDRQTFLESMPEDKGKHVNDDAKLFSHIVKEQRKPIYRLLALKITYLQRQNIDSQKNWLIGRGVLFADFVMFKQKAFLLAYLASWAALLAAVIFGFYAPKLFLCVIVTALIAYSAIALWLAKSLRDFLTFLKLILPLGFYFWIGVGKGLLKKIALHVKQT